MSETSEETTTIPKEQLKELLEWNQQLQNTILQKDEEIKAMYFAVMKVTDMLGVSENGIIKPSMKDKNVNPVPEVIKAASGLVTLMFQSGMPVIGADAKKKLTEKFSFFGDMLPIFEKYENQYGKK